jgi:hypothetical protein
MTLPRKQCIVCGRSVKRITQDLDVRPACAGASSGYSIGAHVVADMRTRADCLRHTNQPYVVSTLRGPGGFVSRMTVWDGVSFYHDGFFCTGRCAQSQGYASARRGDRFRWNSGT